jgi:glycosyltransferase-like protein
MTSMASMMGSVGLFTYSTVPRGSVVHTAHLADGLVEAGWDVTLYALDKDGRGFFRPTRARQCLVPAGPAPGTDTAALVAQRTEELADHLLRARPKHDLFHAQDCLSASGLLAVRGRGLPLRLVRTVHHVERFADPYLDACQTRSIREADLCLTVSAAARRDVAAGFGVQSVVVGNGVDCLRFARPAVERVRAWRDRLLAGARRTATAPDTTSETLSGAQPPGPVVLAVGGIEPRKNSLRLLAAFARVRAHHPRAQLWFLGGATVLDHGAYRAAFWQAHAALPADMRSGVVELGVLGEDDVPAIFHLADVLALPSLHEGFGLAALEALAAGVPLVASARPPFTEFLDPSCAILVDPENEAAIADGLLTALRTDDETRRAAGRRCAAAHGWAGVALRHGVHYERTIRHARDALHRSLA